MKIIDGVFSRRAIKKMYPVILMPVIIHLVTCFLISINYFYFMRLFLSMNPEQKITDEFFEVQKKLISDLKHLPDRSIKWEEKSKFHITLFFLGDVDKPKVDSLLNKLDDLSSVPEYGEMFFNSTGLECFPNANKPRVIFAEINNEDKKAYGLYEKLIPVLDSEGFKPDKKLHLHITLGRVKTFERIEIRTQIEKMNFNICISVKSFSLMQSVLDSRGSVYREIRKFGI